MFLSFGLLSCSCEAEPMPVKLQFSHRAIALKNRVGERTADRSVGQLSGEIREQRPTPRSHGIFRVIAYQAWVKTLTGLRVIESLRLACFGGRGTNCANVILKSAGESGACRESW